jgi:TolB-like protein
MNYGFTSTKPKGNLFMRLPNIFIPPDHGHGARTRYSTGPGPRTRSLAIGLLSLAMMTVLALPALSAGPFRVAILPFQIHSAEDLSYLKEGIYDIISSRLAASGQIDVIGKSSIERVLTEMRPSHITEEVAREAGIRLKADYVVLGSITKIAEFISLDARLIDTTGQKPASGAFAQTKGLDQLMGKVDEFATDIGGKILGEPAVLAKEGEPKAKTPYGARPKRSPIIRARKEAGIKKSPKLPFEIKGLDIADVDGDGRNEIILMDRHNLWIYQYIEEKLRTLTTLKSRANQDFLTLDAADLNGNGTAEIFITSIVGEDLNSFILEYEGKAFKRLGDKNGWYFRVLDLPQMGPTLLGQKMGVQESFSGPIRQFRWKKNGLAKGKKLKLPKETQLLGLAIADITGDGKAEIIRFDDDDRLRVFSADGKDLLYKTSTKYGGSNNFFDRESIPQMVARDHVPKRVFLQGRIVVLDLDGDEKAEVIVNKNHFSSGRLVERVRLFDKGEVYDLAWDGMMLAEQWRTREIPGYIADYQVKDFDNDGDRELVVAIVSESKTLKRSDSRVLFYELY